MSKGIINCNCLISDSFSICSRCYISWNMIYISKYESSLNASPGATMILIWTLYNECYKSDYSQ